MSKKVEIPRPETIRKGQMIVNFLEWLHIKDPWRTCFRLDIEGSEACKIADPFYIKDDEFDALFKEFEKSLLAQGI